MRRRKKNLGKYKSKFEQRVAAKLPSYVQYEADKIKYTVVHTYNPDWKIGPNDYIETKGRFTSADRAKHLHIKKQHPEVRIRFLFEKPYNTLTRVSKTTYADWCEKHGFEWAGEGDDIIKEWLK